ncbi:MAG: GspH/FimT family pseudopilin [Candidatus Electronema sp. VV]
MTRRIRHCAKDEAGFSFAELMVVIALIGILSAIALPSLLGGLPEKKQKNAAIALYSDLQRARLTAVKENRSQSVQFSTDDGGYYYFETDGAAGWKAGEFRRDLRDYSASYGCASVNKDWNDNAPANSSIKFVEDGIPPIEHGVVFNSIGNAVMNGLDSNNVAEGMVYLGRSGSSICYAVGVGNFGAVKVRRFDGSAWK